MSLAERLLNYCNQILDGEIKACKKHKWAVERFLNDLSKIENEDYPYYFDGDVLEDFYLWAKMFKHTKGVLANTHIELTDFQLFIVANIFCWKSKRTGYRRFRYVYIQLARKNAKSQLLALIASYVAFLSGELEEVYIGGMVREQSQLVYNEIKMQIQKVKELKRKYKDSYGKITHNKTGSVIMPLSKDSGRSAEGKNPSLAIIDEFHLHPTDEIYEVMKSGMVGRAQPLMVIITTAGLDLDTPCYREYQYVSRILNPEDVTENEDYFALVCEIDEFDDINDESVFIKANPIVATYEEGIKSIRSELKVAQDVPEKMTKFLTKTMNRWVQMRESGYMDLAKWNECGIKEGESLPDLMNRKVYIGIDLASTEDICAVGFVVPIENGKYVVLGHSFIPEEKLKQRKMKRDKANYDSWLRQKWLTVNDGAIIDYSFVSQYIDNMVEKYQWKVEALCYDDWNSSQFINEAMDKGYLTVKVVQGHKSLYPPTKRFRELVYTEDIIHDNNPVINWAFGHAVTRLDPNMNYILDKKKSTEKIDPVACIMNAFSQAMHHEDEGINDILTDDYLDKLGWG